MEKVIDIEERIPTLKNRRRRRTNKKFSILLLLFVLTLVVVLYFQSSYSQVQQIDIEGAALVPEEQYLEQSTIHIGDSMWSFKEKDLQEKLENNDWVESATVKKEWLTTVTIKVKEYEKVGYVESGETFQQVLANGKLMESLDQILPVDGPLLGGFDEENIRLRLIKELSALEDEVLYSISEINYTPSENDKFSIRVYMNDGNEVQAIIPSFAEKMKYYPSIVGQLEPGAKGIIDLEVGSFFQPYQEVYTDLKEEEMEDEEGQTPE